MLKTVPEQAAMATEDFERFGVNDVAYIKPVFAAEGHFYVVHAADGAPLLIAKDRELAFAAVRQHDMQPLSLH